MAAIQCIVVTPELTALDSQAEFVTVPLFDGELGIGAGHSPLIGRLGYGELRLRKPNGPPERFYVDGGFVQVAKNVVTILTSRLVPANKIDQEAARQQLQSAMQKPIETPELLRIRDRAVEQARSQIRAAQRASRS